MLLNEKTRHDILDEAQAVSAWERMKGAIEFLRPAGRPRFAASPAETLPALVGLSEREIRNYSVLSMVRHVAANHDGRWRKIPTLETECTLQIEMMLNNQARATDGFFVPYEIQRRSFPMTRADTVGVGAAGGYLVATELVSFIDLLRNRTVAFRLGAFALSGLAYRAGQGNISIPKLTGAATASWLASETAQVNGGNSSNQAFSQLSLSPHNVGAYTEISRQLLMQSTPSAEALVMWDLAAVIAIALDEAAINGPGTDGAPVGILNTPNVQAFGGTVSTIPWASLLAMEADLLTSNVPMTAPAWASTVAIAQALADRQTFAGGSLPIWAGSLVEGTINENRAMSSGQVPSGTLILGDWNQMVIADWGQLEIEVNPYANFQAGLIGVRAIAGVDIGLRNPAAFCVATGVT
jgi:HK97 family phage major capsid protein